MIPLACFKSTSPGWADSQGRHNSIELRVSLRLKDLPANPSKAKEQLVRS